MATFVLLQLGGTSEQLTNDLLKQIVENLAIQGQLNSFINYRYQQQQRPTNSKIFRGKSFF